MLKFHKGGEACGKKQKKIKEASYPGFEITRKVLNCLLADSFLIISF